MKLAVLSGKGGAGKTFAAVNLAAAGRGCYIDCDVEEPNGRLFFKPDSVVTETVTVLQPEFDTQACSGCRKCVDFCRYHALALIRKRPMLFTEVCHSCGGCALICPEGAVREVPRAVGVVERGSSEGLTVVTGVLEPGEASGIPVIQAAMSHSEEGLTVLDCPPGSACPVMETAAEADVCLLVAEPTAFGFHNFCMVHELAELLGKPCAVLINKQEEAYPPLEEYCSRKGLPVLARIPYSREAAASLAQGEVLSRVNEDYAALFRGILQELEGMGR